MTAPDESELLRLLGDRSCYPHAPAAVELVQTHISIVALAGDLVFKLKKSVRLPFLDFSTRERRRAVCRDEVHLNRRLCRDTYLGIATLRREGDGVRFSQVVDDEGPDDGRPAEDDEVDFAVVMRRLPADRMLDAMLQQQTATTADLDGLARTLAAFHARADRSERITELGSADTLCRLAADNFEELAAVRDHGLLPELLAATAATSTRAFDRVLTRLRARAAAGFVVDGHGDLHARNLCMTDPPTVYDCLEFSARLRCCDVATEIAFLVMDLRHRGAGALAKSFVAAYVAASGDRELPSLLPPLVAYRAMVRCKVSAMAAAETEIPAAQRARARESAASHLLLAAAANLETLQQSWLVLCGPPGSGKSTLAQHLHDATGFQILATDRVRKELAGLQPNDRASAEHYTAEFSTRTYATVLARATAATANGARSILLDGNFATRELRSAAATAARAAGAAPVFVHVTIPEADGSQRVATRTSDPARISDADPANYRELRARFVAPTAVENAPVVTISGLEPTSVQCARTLAAISTLASANS